MCLISKKDLLALTDILQPAILEHGSTWSVIIFLHSRLSSEWIIGDDHSEDRRLIGSSQVRVKHDRSVVTV